jgi:hypothetical protein
MVDNIAANCDWTGQPRDFEARVLAELLRLSRVTVLHGGEGVGKTTLLKTGLLPLLRARAQDRNPARNVKTLLSRAFSEHHAEDGTSDNAVIAIVFDRWTSAPLVALQSQISDVLRREHVPLLLPRPSGPSLAANLAAWNRAFGVRFFILLDAFEQYLHAPLYRADIGDFDDEFVRMVNDPSLPVRFLLSVRDEAEGLLSQFQRRISFGDVFVRLPTVTLTAPAFPNGSAEPPRPLAVPEDAKAKAEVERKVREAAVKAMIEAEKNARQYAEQQAEAAAKAPELETQARTAAAEASEARKIQAEAEANAKAAEAAVAKAWQIAEEAARSKAQEEARAEKERQAHAEAETKTRAAVEAQMKALRDALQQAELRTKREAEERARMEQEIRARQETERKAREEAELRAKAAEEAVVKARAMAEEAGRAKAEAETRARNQVTGADAEARARMEAAMKALEEARAKAREEAHAREAAEAKARAEAGIRKREEVERRTREEAQRKAREQEETRAKAQMRELQEQARRAREEAEATIKAERKARQEAEAKAEAERRIHEEALAKARDAMGGGQPPEARRTVPSPVRPEFRSRVRSLGWQLTAIGAAFAVVVGAGYFAMYAYHGNRAQQIASSAKDATPVTRQAADASTITAASASRADDFVPPPLSPPRSDDVARTPQVRESVSPRRSPPIESAAASRPPNRAALTKLQEAAPVAPAKLQEAAPVAPAKLQEAAPVAPAKLQGAAPVAPAPAKTHSQTAMRAELDVCRKERFLERVVCIEQVRWRYCAPNGWNTIPECGVTGS